MDKAEQAPGVVDGLWRFWNNKARELAAECEALRVERDDLAIRALTIDEALTNSIQLQRAADARLKRIESALAWAENADPLLVDAIRDRALASEDSADG